MPVVKPFSLVFWRLEILTVVPAILVGSAVVKLAQSRIAVEIFQLQKPSASATILHVSPHVRRSLNFRDGDSRVKARIRWAFSLVSALAPPPVERYPIVRGGLTILVERDCFMADSAALRAIRVVNAEHVGAGHYSRSLVHWSSVVRGLTTRSTGTRCACPVSLGR